jgi:hypothetical protein
VWGSLFLFILKIAKKIATGVRVSLFPLAIFMDNKI